MVNIHSVDLLQLASNFEYATSLQAITNASTDHVSLLAYDQSFITDILGTNVTQKLVADLPWDAFHEAGVYNIATGKIYATSNWAGSLDNPINITIIDPDTGAIDSVRYAAISEGNGGCSYYPPGVPANSSEGQQIVWADSADFRSRSKLVTLDPSTNASTVLLNNYRGKNFSSINDVVQHPHTGDLWFTDARYAFWQDFGPTPQIRPQVYRFEPRTGVVQAVADDFIAPNGIEFSPDFQYLYVTDTGSHTVAGEDDPTGPTSIYRFRVSDDGKRLGSRELFAYVDRGFPDGIHTDTRGNVYTSSEDGVQVFNPEGVLVGKFGIGGKGSNNFVFVPGGIYIFNAFKLFYVSIKAEGRLIRRDFGLKDPSPPSAYGDEGS
jgi:gluconolactonase